MQTNALMKRIVVWGVVCLMGPCGLAQAEEAPGPAAAGTRQGESLTLKDFVQLISRSDEMVIVQRLEEDVAQEGIHGAKAIFEPSFFVTAEKEGTKVQNTASEILQRAGRAEYDSETLMGKTGIGMKVATGAETELSYNLSRIENSLQKDVVGLSPPEYRSYVGVKVMQPLLRGAGVEATTTPIKVAEHEKKVAAETVRQVLTQRVMEGVVVYLNVQRAQERVRLRGKALAIAEQLLPEIRAQQKIGLKTAGEVLDAESSAALRRAQLAQAQQDYEEQLNTFQGLVTARERAQGSALAARLYKASDPLALLAGPLPEKAESPAAGEGEQALPSFITDSLERRPEYRVNKIRQEREETRVRYAKNQRLPELNVTARYGFEDLTDETNREYFDFLGHDPGPYYSWDVQLQFKYYLFGDEKRSSDLRAAELRQKQVSLAQSALQQRIANEVESSAAVLDKGLQNVQRQQEVVRAQHEIIKVEENLVKEGRNSVVDLLKKQLDALVAEEALVDSIIVANRASFVNSQAQGMLLARMGLE